MRKRRVYGLICSLKDKVVLLTIVRIFVRFRTGVHATLMHEGLLMQGEGVVGTGIYLQIRCHLWGAAFGAEVAWAMSDAAVTAFSVQGLIAMGDALGWVHVMKANKPLDSAVR